MPDADAAVQVPAIGVNETDLFYLLNWNRPFNATSSGGMDGYVMRVPIRGGKAVRVASVPGGGSSGGQGLVVTPTAVIFSAAPASEGSPGTIVSVAAAGGEPQVLASTNGLANALVADDRNVYFVDSEATKSVPLTGGPVRTLATAVPYSLGIVGGTLYLAEYGTINTVSSVPVQGGPITVLATDPDGVLYPVGCGPNLCWVSGPPLGASLKQLAPGGAPVVLAQGFTEPHGLVFDGNDFFVSTGGGGLFLYRIPAAGGTPVLVESHVGIADLALDEACLYWSAFPGIYSLARSAADAADGG